MVDGSGQGISLGKDVNSETRQEDILSLQMLLQEGEMLPLNTTSCDHSFIATKMQHNKQHKPGLYRAQERVVFGSPETALSWACSSCGRARSHFWGCWI